MRQRAFVIRPRFVLRELADDAGAGAGGRLAGDMEGFEAAILGKGATEGVVVGLEQFRPLDAAVERHRMTDGMLLHRLPQGDERRQHVGLDLLVPPALVRPHEDILSDQLRHFIPGDGDADDPVIAEDGRVILQCPFEGEQVEGLAVDGGVLHAQHFVALARIAALRGRHEDAAADGQIRIVQQVGEQLVAVAHRLVRLVHDAEVEAEPRGAGRLGRELRRFGRW